LTVHAASTSMHLVEVPSFKEVSLLQRRLALTAVASLTRRGRFGRAATVDRRVRLWDVNAVRNGCVSVSRPSLAALAFSRMGSASCRRAGPVEDFRVCPRAFTT